ncbi:chloride channel 3 [Coprinopsis cinerea okayama7|uniref:Chloride channel 3 n=1 Tax=Coprinopsis cinerea (strain Okayama-7 / 130 / ATCC MYA-4618 / FGSC 9003) TaxID=240176 RepID=A8N9B5_COPC7|nr:chloride channel 3 [Coprinopsis cinerea okayama7\|eukprot:XP_001831443.2 chloride channel 3 [Coprinopsis cinerea okayama7\
MSFGLNFRPNGSLGVDNYNHSEAQQYELTEYGLLAEPPKYGDKYRDGSSIDWLHEENAERERNHALQSEAANAGETCDLWQRWADVAGIKSMFGQSLLQTFIYVTLAVIFAGSSAFLVVTFAPYFRALFGERGKFQGGPLVHVACCFASLFSRMFTQFRHNEELDTFANETEVMWKGFVASAIAAMALQWVNPFGTAKLVLFQVTAFSDQWRAFELGVLGSWLIRLNVEFAIYRRQSVIHDWPVLEVVAATNLFQDCDPNKADYHGLCNMDFWHDGKQSLYRSNPKAWLFLSCPPDPSVRCISPGFYAVIGAAAMLGGVTRMTSQSLFLFFSPSFSDVSSPTVSLVVILFELTGALSHVLPIMICVMTSKWVGDALGKDGIYSVWIAMRRYPWLPPVDYRDNGETGAHLMKPVQNLIVVRDGETTVGELAEMLDEYSDFHGFPVIDNHGEFIGYATRDALLRAIDGTRFSDSFDVMREKKCTFSQNFMRVSASARVDMSSTLERALIQLRKEVPQELVVAMFQKLRDVVTLLTSHFPHAGSLAQGVRPT